MVGRDLDVQRQPYAPLPFCPLTTAEPRVGIPHHANLTGLSRNRGLPASRLLGFSFSTLTLPISSRSQYNPLIEGWEKIGTPGRARGSFLALGFR